MHISMIHCIEERLTSMVLEQLNSDDISCVDTEELGEVIDMIKDLAETKEKLYKANYYDSVVKAMNRETDKVPEDAHSEMIMSHPDEFTMKSLDMIRKAWANATPDTRKHMRSEVVKLSTEMVV